MAQKLKASLPPDLDLGSGYTLEFAAVDPTTGAAVTGVAVSSAYMVVAQISPGTPSDLQTELFVPLLTPVQIDEQAATLDLAQVP